MFEEATSLLLLRRGKPFNKLGLLLLVLNGRRRVHDNVAYHLSEL